MSKFSIKINCIDCNAERMITKACRNLVTRCKSCQKKINSSRTKARYLRIKAQKQAEEIAKGNEIKPKKKRKPRKKKTTVEEELALADLESKKIPEEERKIRMRKMEKLLRLLNDDSTIDDW